MSLDAMQELTGFHLRRLANVKAWATPAGGRPPGLDRPFGIQRPVALLFAVDGQANEVLFTYPDGTGAVVFQKSEDGHGASLFVGVPGLTSELLRFAARRAGVHLYTETDCNVYANGPFVAVHASQDGPLSLNVGQPKPVTDALTGQPVGDGPSLTLPLHRGETRVLKIGP